LKILICERGASHALSKNNEEALRALFFLDTSVRWYDVRGGASRDLSKNKEALRALFFLDTSVRWYDVRGALRAIYLKACGTPP